ncbi:MAG: hypothetical protein ACRD2B_08325 [Terriglobia bacterium]
MIECIFTLDYEIYGNGAGALKDLVYGPAQRLKEIFERQAARFVVFVEVAELEKIDAWGTDPAIGDVRRQIQDFRQGGFEIGLHLHPQWCNARYEHGQWLLDYSEYNLCPLPRRRVSEIVESSLGYLRQILKEPRFTPLSFRAGNWLFQPTETAASVLAESGVRIDSSVFKGGLQHNHKLDYRRALRNGYYWTFSRDVIEPDPQGQWLELPIYTEMVPFWRMPTSKRLRMSNGFGTGAPTAQQRVNRVRDLVRARYPLKLDFCRMTLKELTSMLDGIVSEDRAEPGLYRPVVAIGHTKDLTEPAIVDAFLSFLRANAIPSCTFEAVYSRLRTESRAPVEVGPPKQ